MVVDTETTSKLLLQRGRLQTRTTIIPLNKISPHVTARDTVRLAQDIVSTQNYLYKTFLYSEAIYIMSWRRGISVRGLDSHQSILSLNVAKQTLNVN